jgi:hypothetical protein
MSGGSLSTKGLISGGGGPTTEQALVPPPPDPLALNEGTLASSVMIVAPTAPNVCLMVSENITRNLLVRQDSNIVLPSLYKRAYLIAYETDEVAFVK